MALYLGILLFSFTISAIAVVPFIDLLYRIHFLHQPERSGLTKEDSAASKTLHRLHRWKGGTPVGGGMLIIFLVSIIYLFLFPLLSRFGVYIKSSFSIKQELNVIFFSFISFGILGLYDDLIKIFPHRPQFLPLSSRLKRTFQLVLSFICSVLIHQGLGVSLLYVPFFGPLQLGWLYPLVSTIIIFIFSTAVDFSDGLDGLASGLLFICLTAFWVVSLSAVDTPISVFIALWLGSLLAFLYFNVFPARLWLGNAGSISFGATLAVIALILGKSAALIVIGGLFLMDYFSSILQFLSVKLWHHRLFSITPLHHLLQIRGWPEPKIVMRSWLLGLMLAVAGLWLGLK